MKEVQDIAKNILVKVDEMYNIVKSVLATVYRNSHINVSSKQV